MIKFSEKVTKAELLEVAANYFKVDKLHNVMYIERVSKFTGDSNLLREINTINLKGEVI